MTINRRHFLQVAGSGGITLAAQRLSLARGVPAPSILDRDAKGQRIAASTALPYRPYRSKTITSQNRSTWVKIDLESNQIIESVKLYPSHTVLTPGDGFPLRFSIECSLDPDFRESTLIVDRSTSDYPDPEDRVLEFDISPIHARYVRVTALSIRPKKFAASPGKCCEADGLTDRHFSLSKVAIVRGAQDIAVGRPVSVDPVWGNPEDAQQITRSERPQGEGVITDNPSNMTDPSKWTRATEFVASPSSGVILEAGSLFHTAFLNNIEYLTESYSVDELLHDFRERAGKPDPAPTQKLDPFWDEALGGSNAGRFLMGAGNTLKWTDNPRLRSRLASVVDGIAECRDPDGYIMGYPRDAVFTSEHGAYARSWLTLGLIAAGSAGSAQALDLIRGHYDWLNRSELLPQMLRRCNQGGQGMVANTQVALSSVGRPKDAQVAQRYFQESYWMKDLAQQDANAVWQYPYDRPHTFLLTNILAYLDLYSITGDANYLKSVEGGWELFNNSWENTGGSISIIETESCAPHSNKLFADLGETCGSAFWILLNHGLHRLRPHDEKYVAEIEKSVYNVILANQQGALGYRYHTALLGTKEPGTRISTCCEGQGSRIVGSLPEYIYSLSSDGLYVNLYEPSAIEWNYGGGSWKLAMRTGFPRDMTVDLEIAAATTTALKLNIRIPCWASEECDVRLNGSPVAKGRPGTYCTLERQWSVGDKVSFTPPIALRMTKYTGTDQIEGRERYAIEYGPILMAAVGVQNSRILLFLSTGDPADLLRRLKPQQDGSCHFLLEESSPPIRFLPYFEITDQPFTCFPIIECRSQAFPEPSPRVRPTQESRQSIL
jgi:uncharacterized protein